MIDMTHSTNLSFGRGSLTSRSGVESQHSMKAAIYRKYGGPDVVVMAQVPKPKPKSDEVLVRIHATTVNSGDWRARSLDMRGSGHSVFRQHDRASLSSR